MDRVQVRIDVRKNNSSPFNIFPIRMERLSNPAVQPTALGKKTPSNHDITCAG